MKWKDFKEKVEKAGIIDENEICYIDVNLDVAGLTEEFIIERYDDSFAIWV